MEITSKLKTQRALIANVRKRIRAEAADLVAFASDMIRVPSENPPGKHYSRCSTLIAQRLRQLGLHVGVANPSGEAACVIGTFGDAGRALYFSGHYDVVPAQSPSQFEPVVRRRCLFGRGAADMKGGIAAMAFAIRALATSGFEPRGRLISVSVPDEETSGTRGTVGLQQTGFIERNAIGMLTMEPTGGVVWNANRGVISMRVSVRGKPAHVGLHFRGVNAFRGMLDVANRLAALDAKVSKRETRFSIAPNAARRSVLLLGGEMMGGHNFNVVPDAVSFTLDRRLNPEEDFDTERAALLALIGEARADGIRVDAEIFQEGHPAATDAKSDLGRALASSIHEIAGAPARFELCPGVLETRHYVHAGVPAMAYGPGHLAVSHGPNEFVSVKNLLRCAEVYALTAMSLLS